MNLTDTLQALALPQAGLARLLQVDVTTVNRWATGRRDVPRAVILLLGLMHALQLSAADVELLAKPEDPKPEDPKPEDLEPQSQNRTHGLNA
jgi:transcriptional regulator with XRE-family HTH domain